MNLQIEMSELLNKMRNKAPIIHNITNYVVMNSSANNLLAIGASPIMAHAEEEMDEMVKIANALVINIGTLSSSWILSMKKAALTANSIGTPVILDPVGVMCSNLRKNTCEEFLNEIKFTAIRGNASEIIGLHSLFFSNKNTSTMKGVDSLHSSKDALHLAKELSHATKSVICISGEIDYVVSDDNVFLIQNGHPIMTKVTGMGCSSTAIIAAFLSLKENPLYEVLAGQLCVSLAGELSINENTINRPGSFEITFRDKLSTLSTEDFKYAKISKL